MAAFLLNVELFTQLSGILMLAALAYSGKPPMYEVLRTPSTFPIDGSLLDEAWSEAPLLPALKLPWHQADLQTTEARFLWDANYLYAAFRVWDKEIVTWTDPKREGKLAVVDHDRVEMFFALDDDLKEYYCLEVDPKGLVLDYKARHYRNFDYSWRMEGLRVATSIQENGYTVELAIPFSQMKRLGFPASTSKSGFSWRVGVYRADFSLAKPGELNMLWQTWVDPNVAEPDFHVPSSFGLFRFVNRKDR
jgi:cellulose/xylan binding protein with CBM9 domain